MDSLYREKDGFRGVLLHHRYCLINKLSPKLYRAVMYQVTEALYVDTKTDGLPPVTFAIAL